MSSWLVLNVFVHYNLSLTGKSFEMVAGIFFVNIGVDFLT